MSDITVVLALSCREYEVCIEADSQSLQIDLMDHSLYTISYVADIDNVLVIMINRIQPPAAQEGSVQRGGEGGGWGEGEGMDKGEGGEGGERGEGRE